jgi:hypothetical protein
MRRLRFWIPPLIGLFVSPLLYFLLAYTGGPGPSHTPGLGQLLVFYPIPMLMVAYVLKSTDSSSPQIVMDAAFWIQFPLYGFIVSFARLKKTLWLKILAGLVWVHIITIALLTTILMIKTVL